MSFNLFFEENSAYLITDGINREYFSGVCNSEGWLVIAPNKTTYFADARYFTALKEKLKNSVVEPALYKSLLSIKDFLVEAGIKILYLDYHTTTLSQYESYKALGVEIKNGSKAIFDCRKSKTQSELDSIKKACEIAKNAYEHVIPFIKEGVTEKSIKTRLERFMKKQGAEKPSFDTIVAFGKNSAVPHHETGNAKLKKNQTVLMDYGCVVNGYCSDITRTVFYGKPSEKFIKTFDLVAKANQLGMQKAKAGVLAKTVDSSIRDFFDKHGVADKFTHSLGHGIGLEIHEEPYLSPRGEGELKENYVFSIEPGLYYEDEFGVRIENTVTIQNGIATSLTGNGRELKIIK